jgi:hypothetical protein
MSGIHSKKPSGERSDRWSKRADSSILRICRTLTLSHIEHDDVLPIRVEHSIGVKAAPTPFVQNKAEYNEI